MKIRFIDLFAGVGGVRLGFESAAKSLGLKTECVFSSEINEEAQQTYALNFNETPAGDITKIKSEDVPSFDFLLGGFPCQPFSYAGKMMGFGDTRGTLFFEIERILAHHKPWGFMLENVRGLTSHDKGRTFETILRKLRTLGYSVGYTLLNSSSVGVPQNRVRVYIVGVRNDKLNFSIPSDLGARDSHHFKELSGQPDLFNQHPVVLVKSILEKNPNKKYDCSADFSESLSRIVEGDFSKLHGVRLIDTRHGNSIHSWEVGIKGPCNQNEIKFMNLLISNRRKKIFGREKDGKMLTADQIFTFCDRKLFDKATPGLLRKGYLKCIDGQYSPVAGNMSFEVFKFLDPNSISITLVSSDAHKLGVYHNGRLRRITPRECARLQGFPDSFVLHPKDDRAYHQFGNSVSVPVVCHVLKHLLESNKFKRKS
jgi:DNA (cytosine-5)-methyltransferase 1